MVDSLFQFSQPKLPKKNSLQRKLDWTKVEVKDIEFTLPSFPPKTLANIVQLIDDNRADEVSIFEWLDIVEDEVQWLNLSEDKRYDACRAVWQQISIDTKLGDIVFFRIAQQLDDEQKRVVSFLADTMTIARTAKNLSCEVIDKIDWLLALQEQNWNLLAQICFEKFTPTKTFLLKQNLPVSNQYQFKLTPYLVQAGYERYLNISQLDNWLIKCFECIKTTKHQIIYFESVLSHLNRESLPQKSQELLKTHCLPFEEDSYWYQLSETCREKLHQLFNLSRYYSLHSICRFLYNDDNYPLLGIDEKEAKTIRSRSLFWSNYSQQFRRAKVFLPLSTYEIYKKKFGTVPDYVSVLKDNENDRSGEVLIFEFDKVIVVEVLRGTLSETRIFKNNEWHAQRLFDATELTLGEIRGLAHLDVHDHVLAWQYYCEKLLRIKYKIAADVGLPYFKGLPPGQNTYSQQHGLPSPARQIKSERAILLEQWVEAFWAREFQTDKYGNQSGLQKKSNLYLNKASIEKQCGNEEQYLVFIKKAANQGNSEAMWILGKDMLTNAKSDLRQRKYGEEWIGKAASQGHKEATDTAKRFNIPFR